MAFIEYAARVAETAAAPGTGAFTLAGAAGADYRAFSAACANGDTFPYAALCPGVGWETGIGTWNTGGTITRPANVLENSLGTTAKINFTAATTIWLGYPGLATLMLYAAAKAAIASADRLPILDVAGGNLLKYVTADTLKFWTTRIPRSARTANTILAGADLSTLIDITSGTFTQTFTAAATLGDGWWCLIRNAGTGEITLDPNGSETIDGLTSFKMYANEVRQVMCDGANFRSIVLVPFLITPAATMTFTEPPGYKAYNGFIQAPGGGGGSGRRGPSAAARGGGGSGYGGSYGGFINGAPGTPGGTFTITVGAKGTGGAAQSVDTTNGNTGATGGDCSIGGYLYVQGGLGGSGGTAGGSGTQGTPTAPTAVHYGAVGQQSAAGAASAGVAPSALTTFAATAGGPGGGITSGNVATDGAAGGASTIGSSTVAGGAAGTTAGTRTGSTGNTSSNTHRGGTGGGGGASHATNAGAAGGNGARGGGGGGGSASINGTLSGAGGDGGDPYVELSGVL